MGVRDDCVPDSFVRILLKIRPNLKDEPAEVRQNLAYLAWVSPTKSRQHKGKIGYMSITYQELDKRFGRTVFTALNKRLNMFAVTPNWWKTQGLTRGFKLKQDMDTAVADYVKSWRRRQRKIGQAITGLDGKSVLTTPYAVAARDSGGGKPQTWKRTAITNDVPVDMPRLYHYSKTLERMLDDPQPDFFFPHSTGAAEYLVDCVARLSATARQIDGTWFITQRYVESPSGRLYGRNINLQTVPREIKQAALHGLYEYDFENCHYTILHQLAARHGLECPAIAHYLKDKRRVRQQIVDDIGLSVDEAKKCLIALIYGARYSHRDEDAIPAAIGKAAALQLYKHPLFNALKEDVANAGTHIIGKWPRKRKSFINDFGKGLLEEGREAKGNLKELPKPSPAQILAHLLQGIEAKMLGAVRQIYGDKILLLQHDGFASSVKLDTGKMEQAILTATGYTMAIEESKIALDAGLGI